jgi:proliferating cell nuclear antigen PCNA
MSGWTFTLNDKKKKDLFLSVFHVLKTTTSHVHTALNSEHVHIQGMDKSHVCLFDLYLKRAWFDAYQVDTATHICFDTTIFYSMLNTKSEDQNICIKMASSDTLDIELVSEKATNKSGGGYDKFFTLPLMEYDYEEMGIPETEYDAEFSLPAKNITNLLSQLSNFGTDLRVTCTDDDVDFDTKGPSGDMRVRVHIDDMSSYSVVEGQALQVSYSLMYVSKMCVSNKLSPEIEFSLSGESPMRIKYDLGDDSSLVFYIAPKVSDD